MKKFSLGLEAIDFQKDDIFDRLVEQFKLLRSTKKLDVQILQKIKDMVLDRFGTNIRIIYTDGIEFTFIPIPLFIPIVIGNEKIYMPIPFPTIASPKVYIPTANKNHAFLTNQVINGIDENIKNIKFYDTVNTVDLKNAKLSGAFKEMKYDLVMNIRLKTVLTPEEEAAVFLHEIGHIFTFFEHMRSTVTTNLILLNVSMLATSTVTEDEKKTIFKKHVDELNIDPNTFIGLEKANSVEQACVMYLSNKKHKVKSTSGSSMYDTVSAEQSADQFVSRLGGGRHLVTALDKFNRMYFGKRSILSNIYLEAYKVFGIGMLLYSLQAAAFGPISILIIANSIYATIKELNTSVLTFGYDDTNIRLKRIKNDMVTVLKDAKGIDEQKKIIIAQLEQIDKTLNLYSKQFSIAHDIINKIFRNKDYSAYQIQRDLEDLAFNDLFMKAEKLRLT